MDDEVEEMRRQLYTSLNEAKDDICLNYLRPIKKDMYLCSAKCCDNESYTDQEFIEAVAECYLVTSGANYYIKSTIGDFERRFKTCTGKCESGAGYDPEEDDDEGDDGDVPAEELVEESFPPPPGPEYLLTSYFKELDNEDLEHEPEQEEQQKINLKDCNTCTRLCIESYMNTMDEMFTTMRRDLSATYLSKIEAQGYYYDWSRAQDSPFI